MLYCKEFVEEKDGPTQLHLEFSTRPEGDSEFSFDEPFKYHSRVIQMLCAACTGNQGLYINKIKVRSIFKLDYLLGLLKVKDSFTPLLENNDY